MESINRPELVKEHNLDLLRERLFAVRQATRQQLSALTGISTVTLGGLLQELIQSGEVLEAEKVQPKSGRPARLYYYNAQRKFGLLQFVQLENGAYVFHAALVDLYGEIVEEEQRPAVCLDYQGTYRYFERLLRLREPVGAVGIGLPGIGFGEYLRPESGFEFLNLNALEDLQRDFGIPILPENDVNLAAMGYARRNRLGRESTMAYLYLMKNSFAGSAVYIDGRLHLGKGRFAGEIPPAPYGVDWPRAETEDPEAVVENLVSMTLPYLMILAPHRIVVASDYIRAEHLRALKERLSALVRERCCPEFFLAEDFQQDYTDGVRQLVLDHIADPKEGRN